MLDYASHLPRAPINWVRRYGLFVPLISGAHFVLFMVIWCMFVVLGGTHWSGVLHAPFFENAVLLVSFPGQFLGPSIKLMYARSPLFLALGAINAALFGGVAVGVWQVIGTTVRIFGRATPSTADDDQTPAPAV